MEQARKNLRPRNSRSISKRTGLALVGVRIGLPVVIVLIGAVVLLAGDGDAAQGVGMALIGVALVVVIANVLMRFGLSSEQDRRAEQESRRRFERTGRWDR